jgi:peptidoglycan/LPS O-acetylase OafA/YrhL
MSETNRPAAEYRPDIDGLRAFAVFFVIIFHYFPNILPSGFIGVDIFFAISGYLITGILIKQANNGEIKFIEFYCRRIRRIFPALLCVLIAVILIGYLTLFIFEFQRLGKYVVGSGIFISNFILSLESGYFDIDGKLKVLLHLWSLSIEEQFYLLFPLFIYLIDKKKKNIALITFITFILSFTLNVLLYKIESTSVFYSPITRSWELFAGALLYIVFQNKKSFNNSINNIISVIGTLLIFISAIFLRQKNWPGFAGLLPVLGACAIIFCGKNTVLNKKIYSNKIIVYFGLISYPLYLWHWPFLYFLNVIEGQEYQDCNNFANLSIKMLLILISGLLAAITYKFIEKPIRFNSNYKKYVFALLLSMGIITLLGFIIYITSGTFGRPHVKNLRGIKFQLETYPETNEEALKYINKELCQNLELCVYSGTNYSKTIAIIGDSHATSTYHGFEKYGKIYQFNTLLLHRYIPTYEEWNNDAGWSTRQLYKNQIITDILLEKTDISIVIIVLRGYAHLINRDNTKLIDRPSIDFNKFKQSLQQTIDTLSKNNKKIYIFTGNPELPVDTVTIVGKPILNIRKELKGFYRDSLTKYHGIYNQLLSELHDATIIDVVPIFCPKTECYAFDDSGIPYYADDDHLSFAGSEFQAEGIFRNNLIDLRDIK